MKGELYVTIVNDSKWFRRDNDLTVQAVPRTLTHAEIQRYVAVSEAERNL